MRRILLAFTVFLSGCTLFAKGAPLDVRYFSPETAALTSAPISHPATAMTLRLGHVTSSGNLRSRILHRDTEYEVREYDDLRWTENPEAYIRRRLVRALFEEGSLEQAVSGNAPTLDVELVTFEEVRRGAKRVGRVELEYMLHDNRSVLASGLIAIERDATKSDIEAIVAAISAAMSAATTELAKVVTARLDHPPGAGAAGKP